MNERLKLGSRQDASNDRMWVKAAAEVKAEAELPRDGLPQG